MPAVTPTSTSQRRDRPRPSVGRIRPAGAGLVVLVVLVVLSAPAFAAGGPGRGGGPPPWAASSRSSGGHAPRGVGPGGAGPPGHAIGHGPGAAGNGAAAGPADVVTAGIDGAPTTDDVVPVVLAEAVTRAPGSLLGTGVPAIATGTLGPSAAAAAPGTEPTGESAPSTPGPVLPSGVDPPLTPFVPGNGLGWAIVALIAGAAALGFGVRHATLRRAIRDARHSATRDALTGLANRRLFDEILARELARGARRGTPMALLLVDLDGFKAVNDSRGHAAGDEVLRTVAETIDGRVRSSDLAARIGGDEFAVVLPECAADHALGIGAELCGRISEAVGPAVTASVGVAAAPDHARDADALLVASDAALYRAKSGGRNRAVVAGSSPGSAA